MAGRRIGLSATPWDPGREKDQRIKRVVLSNKGKDLMKNVMPVIEQTRNEVLSGINSKEVETFKIVLKKIYNNLISE